MARAQSPEQCALPCLHEQAVELMSAHEASRLRMDAPSRRCLASTMPSERVDRAGEQRHGLCPARTLGKARRKGLICDVMSPSSRPGQIARFLDFRSATVRSHRARVAWLHREATAASEMSRDWISTTAVTFAAPAAPRSVPVPSSGTGRSDAGERSRRLGPLCPRAPKYVTGRRVHAHR